MSLQRNHSAVKRFARVMSFGTWLQALPHKLTPPPFRLMQIGAAFWQSRALHVAARLDIATALKDKALPVERIATLVSARPDAVYRLLRLLASIGVFRQTSPGVFANNAVSTFLRRDNPKNVRALVLMHTSPEMSRPWQEHLEPAVVDGGVPFQLAHGEDLYSYMDTHPDFDALFAQAMESVDAIVGDSFATDFDWRRFRRVIDIGGSRGSKSATILKRHPHMRALIFDRPHTIEGAKQHWADDPELVGRLEFQAGDLFTAVPAATDGSDVYLLCAILHGFDDAACSAILKTVARAAGAAGAAIAVMEMVVPEGPADCSSAAMDMQMFMATRGRERTLAEWQALFDQSGARLQEVVSLRSPAKMMVLRPR